MNSTIKSKKHELVFRNLIQKVHEWPNAPYGEARKVEVTEGTRAKLFGRMVELSRKILKYNHFDLYLDAKTLSSLTVGDFERGVYWTLRDQGTQFVWPDEQTIGFHRISNLLADHHSSMKVYFVQLVPAEYDPEFYSDLQMWRSELETDQNNFDTSNWMYLRFRGYMEAHPAVWASRRKSQAHQFMVRITGGYSRDNLEILWARYDQERKDALAKEEERFAAKQLEETI